MKNSIEQILGEIFNPSVLGDELPKNEQIVPPSLKELTDVAKLIRDNAPEESFQRFFSKKPHFLFRMAPSTDDTNLGLLAKPPVGNFNFADFAIFSVSQGGCKITLIELEHPRDMLFTKKLTPAKKLQTALGQVDDWNQWIHSNKATFIKTGMQLLKQSPLFPKMTTNGSFALIPKANMEATWNAFGGEEACFVESLIVIGRWSKLNEEEKKRLLYLNSQRNSSLRIRTYDNLIRKAVEGPSFSW